MNSDKKSLNYKKKLEYGGKNYETKKSKKRNSEKKIPESMNMSKFLDKVWILRKKLELWEKKSNNVFLSQISENSEFLEKRTKWIVRKKMSKLK